MPDRGDANLFKILVGQVTQNNEINIILGKALSVLPETELFEPVRNLLHRRPFTGFGAIRSGPACRGSLLTLAKIEYPGPASARPIPNKACSGSCARIEAPKSPSMSPLGQKRTFRSAIVMSALPPKADMCSALAYGCFGPIADIGGVRNTSSGQLPDERKMF